MAEAIAPLLDATRLLLDLQRASDIAQSFSGCLNPEDVARCTTDGLVERFNCAFARIWLVEPDYTALRLVASSGLYTRTNGSFARVMMGAYKVGKIAQNRVSFLSNNLAEESWVKDREWAIAHHINGFAGYPLMVGDRVIGVLATFSHNALAPEFLEVLQVLCTTVSVALEMATQYQQSQPLTAIADLSWNHLTLSDQLAVVLRPVRLTLIGTEQPLSLAQTYVFIRVGEVLTRLNCRHCRLIYSVDGVTLEAIAVTPDLTPEAHQSWLRSHFGMLFFVVSCLGGVLQSQMGANQTVIQVVLRLPYPSVSLGPRVYIQCRLSVLQLAFTHLAYGAGLQVYDVDQDDVLLLTDDVTQIHPHRRILWIQQGGEAVPKGVHASIDLSIDPPRLRQMVEAAEQGIAIMPADGADELPVLSEREREILSLLAQGLRDRDIANHLIISESTVKFHINNVLSKFKARTRFQAFHMAIKQGWL